MWIILKTINVAKQINKISARVLKNKKFHVYGKVHLNRKIHAPTYPLFPNMEKYFFFKNNFSKNILQLVRGIRYINTYDKT